MKESIKPLGVPRVDPEFNIKYFKKFFNKFLLKVKNRPLAIRQLNKIRLKFKDNKPISFLPTSSQVSLEKEAEAILEKFFDGSVIELFRKSQKSSKQADLGYELENSFWRDLLTQLGKSVREMQLQVSADWKYKTDTLDLLYHCLVEYGLHKDIAKRDPIKCKRFNILIQHFHRSENPLLAYRHLITLDELNDQFLNHYKKRKPLKFKGLMIPFEKIHEVKITSTVLLDDEIHLFALRHGFKWNEKDQDVKLFIDACLDETENILPYPYEDEQNLAINPILIAQTVDVLADFPDSLKVYNAALGKINAGTFQRNALDDLRLALELLLRKLLKNAKSLENQISEVGKLLKKRQASEEITNMFVKLIDYYSKYQNRYVKHNDDINKDEIEFVLDLTSSFLKFIAGK